MTIEKFLLFWDSYNVHIIEGLLATIVVLSLLQAYRLFFGKKTDGDDGVHGYSLDAAQIEKTLQKILDAQRQAPAAAPTAKSDDMAINVDLSSLDDATKEAVAAVEAKAAAQVAQMQAEVETQRQQVTQLQEQLKTAAANPAAAAAPAAAGGDNGATAAELATTRAERDALNDKIKDLEARLAEYEIISEDIADLSRYREENDTLKSEIEALKASAGSAPAPAPVEAAPAPAAPVVETAVEAPVVEAAPVPVAEPEVAPVIAAEASQAAAEEQSATDLIDDDLMKEFAAAVEGQKNLSAAADKATTAEGKAAEGDETEKLMGEFESFVNKKGQS